MRGMAHKTKADLVHGVPGMWREAQALTRGRASELTRRRQQRRNCKEMDSLPDI